MAINNQSNEKTFKVGGGHATFTLIVCSLLYMVNYMDRQVFAVVLEPMKLELELTDSQAGVINTVFLLSIALFSVPAAFVIDRWSRRKALSIMAILWSVFTFVTGLGKSFIGVLLPRTVVGVGEAGFSAGGTAMISAAFPKESRSKALGVFNAFITLGAGLGMIIGGKIATAHGWRTPFFIFAVPGVILGIITLFLRDYKTVKEVDESGKQASFIDLAKRLFKIPTLKWLYIGFAMQNVLAFSYLSWTPAFLMRSQGVSAAQAGMTVGIISLMAIIGAPLGGFLADTWQKKNSRGRMLLPTVTMFIIAILFPLAVVFNFSGIGFVFGLLFGTVLMMGLPAMNAITQDVVTPGMKGLAWGMCVLAMYVLGGGWAPLAVGAISDGLGGGAWGLQVALMLSSIGAVLAGIFLFIGSRHYANDAEKVKDVALEAE